MNKRQAESKGYVFTGAYSHDKEEMKERARAERAKGNKAVVVDEPASKYSRGCRGMGYSVYYIESEANKATRLHGEKSHRLAQLRQELAKVHAEQVRLNTQIVELEKELANDPVDVKALAKAIL